MIKTTKNLNLLKTLQQIKTCLVYLLQNHFQKKMFSKTIDQNSPYAFRVEHLSDEVLASLIE
jgi:hypothetical protein